MWYSLDVNPASTSRLIVDTCFLAYVCWANCAWEMRNSFRQVVYVRKCTPNPNTGWNCLKQMGKFNPIIQVISWPRDCTKYTIVLLRMALAKSADAGWFLSWGASVKKGIPPKRGTARFLQYASIGMKRLRMIPTRKKNWNARRATKDVQQCMPPFGQTVLC